MVALRAGETREVNFGASSGASLSGTLTTKGIPSAGGSLCLDGPGRRDRLICYANQKGEYEVEGLSKGDYELEASIPRAGGRWIHLSRKITMAGGDRKKEDFDAGALTIRGRACDSITLQPLAKENSPWIVAHRIDAESKGETISTDVEEDGKFELSLPGPGLYQLGPDVNSGEFYGSNAPTVDLTTASAAEDVRLLLHRDTRDGKVGIQVVDAATGQPVPEGSFRWSSRNCWGAGSFEKAAISDDFLSIGRHKYHVDSEEYVPAEVTLDITPSQRKAEAVVRLLKSDAVLVKAVLPSSPAENAGLQDGDLLVSYDGKPIPNVASLRAIAGQIPVSQKVPLEIRRGNETRVLIVPGKTLGIEAENASRR